MTSHGPALIYDKSTLQGLTEEEAHWLHHHFHCVLTPTIYHEVLADLKKSPREGKTPEEEVAAIAKKVPSYAFTPNMYFRDLVMEDFMTGPVEMTGRPYLGRGKKVKHPDGSTAVFFDVTPEAKAFGLWSDAKFDEMEHLAAGEWRNGLAAIDLKHRRKSFSWMKDPLKGLKKDTELLDFIDKALMLDPYRMLLMAIQYFQVPNQYHNEIVNRWIRTGGKPLSQHIPYVSHILKVDMFFTFLLVKGFISDGRSTDLIDFTYFYYLPFCLVFSSEDNLHRKYAPMLIGKHQKFVEGSFLKKGLGELVSYYAGLPAEVRSRGYSSYAQYPPLDRPFIISSIYDDCCGYDWRSYANEPESPRDPETDKKTLEGVKEWLSLRDQQHQT